MGVGRKALRLGARAVTGTVGMAGSAALGGPTGERSARGLIRQWLGIAILWLAGVFVMENWPGWPGAVILLLAVIATASGLRIGFAGFCRALFSPAGLLTAAVVIGLVLLAVYRADLLARFHGLVLPATSDLVWWGLAILAAGLIAMAVTHHVGAGARALLMREYGPRISSVLGVPVSTVELSSLRKTRAGSLVLEPTPPGGSLMLGSRQTEAEARMAQVLPSFVINTDASGPQRTVFDPIATSPDTEAARARLAETGGLVVAVEDLGDSPARPGGELWRLSEDVSPSHAAKVDVFARSRGLALVEWQPHRFEAVVAALPEETLAIRSRFAQMLKCAEWDLELSVTYAGDRIKSVEILRSPALGIDRFKRVETWRQLVLTIPGGSDGWGVEEDPATGQVTLTYGEPRRLPPMVSASDLLLPEISTKDWATLPLGVNDRGDVVSVDLQAGPHTVVTGGTGSGKSVALRVLMLNVLARGFEVVIIDPVKRAAGLKELGPWTRGIFTRDEAEAAAAIKAVYQEVRRRVDLIDSISGENWLDLPSGSVRPMLVVIDEYASLVTPDARPVGLEKDDPELIQWQELASAKAKIKGTVGKIAREARSAGVHLVLSLQRPDADAIGGSVRENLGSILQLVTPSRPPSMEALRMLFPAEHAAAAQEEIAALNDGSSKGFGLSYIEGGGVQGLRVAFVDKGDLAPYAQRLGLPAGVPLVLEQDTDATVTPPPPPVFAPEPGEQDLVLDLSDIDLSEFDLDTPAAAAERQLVPAPPPLPWGD